MSQLLPLLLALLAAGGLGILLTRLLMGRRARLELMVRMAEQLGAATGKSGREILADEALEDELARVVRGYQKVEGLASRVAELEAERVLARLAVAGEHPATPDATESAATPDAAAAAAEAELILDRARRLTESSFVAGSDALVRVRATLKNLRDWRTRLGATVEEQASALPGAVADNVAAAPSNGDTAPGASSAASPPVPAAALAAVFTALARDVMRLAECARALRPLATAAEGLAGLRPAGGSDGGRRAVPIWDIAASPGPDPRRELLLATLRIRGLAAELETGLTGLRTELRVLGRLPVAPPVTNGRERVARPEGPEPAFLRTLSRLETQLTAVATDIAGLTRDAEHLSRELKRIRLAANGRPAS
jgi:hypothetical protein